MTRCRGDAIAIALLAIGAKIKKVVRIKKCGERPALIYTVAYLVKELLGPTLRQVEGVCHILGHNADAKSSARTRISLFLQLLNFFLVWPLKNPVTKSFEVCKIHDSPVKI